MRPVAVREAFEAPRDAHERVVRLDAGAGVSDAEFGPAHHDVLDRAGAREQRHLARHGVDARCLHTECRTNSAHGLPSAHAHMHSDADRAQVREFARGMRRQPFEAALLNKCRNGLLVE